MNASESARPRASEVCTADAERADSAIVAEWAGRAALPSDHTHGRALAHVPSSRCEKIAVFTPTGPRRRLRARCVDTDGLGEQFCVDTDGLAQHAGEEAPASVRW
jgi:hypothetical protein